MKTLREQWKESELGRLMSNAGYDEAKDIPDFFISRIKEMVEDIKQTNKCTWGDGCLNRKALSDLLAKLGE